MPDMTLLPELPFPWWTVTLAFPGGLPRVQLDSWAPFVARIEGLVFRVQAADLPGSVAEALEQLQEFAGGPVPGVRVSDAGPAESPFAGVVPEEVRGAAATVGLSRALAHHFPPEVPAVRSCPRARGRA
jgi:hypothetical protein